MLGSAPVSILGSGCSSVWLERYLGVVEVASSNLVTPTNLKSIQLKGLDKSIAYFLCLSYIDKRLLVTIHCSNAV